MLAVPSAGLRGGVTAVSAGNHAMAVGYAAQALGTGAKAVMPKTANPARVAGCKTFGAEVELVEDVHRAFARVQQIGAGEARTVGHPLGVPPAALGSSPSAAGLCGQ